MQKLLIVDDEDDLRFTLSKILEKKGYECESAKDGVEALQILSRANIDLVITDLNMPHIDGVRLIQSMAENEDWRTIPVICASGHLGLSAAQFFKQVTVMKKPVNSKLLFEVLDKLLNTENKSTGPPG